MRAEEIRVSEMTEQFFALALQAERIDSECLETPIEPALEAVLSFVLEHPESRKELADAFIHIARGKG